jgi:hypothetical protein
MEAASIVAIAYLFTTARPERVVYTVVFIVASFCMAVDVYRNLSPAIAR